MATSQVPGAGAGTEARTTGVAVGAGAGTAGLGTCGRVTGATFSR